MRVPAHLFDTTGASVGDGLVYDDILDEMGFGPVIQGLTSADSSVTITPNGDGTFDLAAAGGGSLTVQDENSNVATGVTQIDFQGAGVTATAGTGEVVVTIPGGGAGTTVKDRRWSVGSGETSVDEFSDSSLAAAWTRVDGTGAAAANLDWAEHADSLSAHNKGGDSGAIHGLLVPLSSFGGSLSAGDGFVTCVTLLATAANTSIGGILLTDGTTHGSGNQVLGDIQRVATAASIQSVPVTSWTTIGSGAGNVSLGSVVPTAIYLRLALIAANTWRTDLSPNGFDWMPGTATLSKTMTATHVGFGSTSNGTSTSHVASYEYLRRVSGVT